MNILDNVQNLILLQQLVSGNVVSVNISALSDTLNKHRNTIKKKVEKIFEHNIIDRPIFPFLGLYKLYPLLVVLQCQLPNNPKIMRWVKEDPYIFAAFTSRQGEYDHLLFIYHESITSYQLWVDSLSSILQVEYGVAKEEATLMCKPSYFSNQLMIKYSPHSGIYLLEKDFEEQGRLTLNEHDFDSDDLKIMKCLVSGQGIKINEKLVSQKTGLHRKTVEKRITRLHNEGVIGHPVCRFSKFFVPPNHVLTYSLFEIKKNYRTIQKQIIKDPHIPIALKIHHEQYNLLIFGNHRTIGDHLMWEENYRKRFPQSFGRAHITYLSPKMTISFNQQIVSMCLIREKIGQLQGRELRKTIEPTFL
jgi:predicted transcriptional regulator